MRLRRTHVDRARLVASLAAVCVAIVICLHQRHFTLSLWDPGSFLLMLHHRCGLLATAAVLWALIEIVATCDRAVLLHRTR